MLFFSAINFNHRGKPEPLEHRSEDYLNSTITAVRPSHDRGALWDEHGEPLRAYQPPVERRPDLLDAFLSSLVWLIVLGGIYAVYRAAAWLAVLTRGW